MYRLQRQKAKDGRETRGADDAAEAFAAAYPDYQYRFVEFFIEHLSDVGRAFGGDLQQVLVLAVLGQAYLHAARSDAEQPAADRRPPQERASTSASRIADVTGIPRQTVRRKLAALGERGWILRNPDGLWRLAVEDGVSAARRDLSDIDRRALMRVARLYADLDTLVAAREQEAGRRRPAIVPATRPPPGCSE